MQSDKSSPNKVKKTGTSDSVVVVVQVCVVLVSVHQHAIQGPFATFCSVPDLFLFRMTEMIWLHRVHFVTWGHCLHMVLILIETSRIQTQWEHPPHPRWSKHKPQHSCLVAVLAWRYLMQSVPDLQWMFFPTSAVVKDKPLMQVPQNGPRIFNGFVCEKFQMFNFFIGPKLIHCLRHSFTEMIDDHCLVLVSQSVSQYLLGAFTCWICQTCYADFFKP